jgi:hypothetical protein
MFIKFFAILLGGTMLVHFSSGLINVDSITEGPCVHVKALTMEELDFDWVRVPPTYGGFPFSGFS